MSSPLRPRAMTAADLRAAAALHAVELPGGFLAQLGPTFLRHCLATFLDTPGGVALVVDDERGELVGFLVGSPRDGHHRAALQRHARILVLSALVQLAARPRVFAQFVRTRARPSLHALRRPAPAASSPLTALRGLRTAVLLKVAVASRARGLGAGAALVLGLEAAARADGCGRAVLVSFGDKPFYEHLGWFRVSARRNARGQDVHLPSHAVTPSPLDRRSVLRLAALSVLAVGCRGAADDPTVMAASGAPATPSQTRSSAGEDLPAAARCAPLAGERVSLSRR